MKNQKKILLVEDDPDQVIMYQMEIENAGYSFLHSQKGEEVIELVKKEQPSIVLLDMLLGGESKMSGLEVLKSIKGDSTTKELKVIILSNYKKKALEDQCKRLGAVDYLIKAELVPREVVTRVKEILA